MHIKFLQSSVCLSMGNVPAGICIMNFRVAEEREGWRSHIQYAQHFNNTFVIKVLLTSGCFCERI